MDTLMELSAVLEFLDLPSWWLGWVALAIDVKSPSLQALSSTCNKLHNLVFSQAALVPKLNLELEAVEQLGTPAHARALAEAEAALSNLHVEIKAACDDPSLLRTRWVDTCTRAATLHAQLTGAAQQPEPVAYQLQCITRVKLAGAGHAGQNLHLDGLIPDFLVQGCPNLRDLTLDRVTIAAASEARSCSSLQSLTCEYIRVFDAASAPAKQQMLSLPSLTSLSISTFDFQDVRVVNDGIFLAAIDGYSSQLRELSLFCTLPYLPWTPSTKFPHLQHLHMPSFSVKTDTDMQELMQATPVVTNVWLDSFRGLNSSFALEPCSWRELTLLTVRLDQLAKLPLASCTRIACDYSIYLSAEFEYQPTPEEIAAGVEAAQAAGGLQFGGTTVITVRQRDVELVTAAGPLLETITGCAYLEMFTRHTVNPASFSESLPVLTALGQHLRCNEMMACLNWSSNPGTLAELEQIMPRVEHFSYA